jgi:hypothetical protein
MAKDPLRGLYKVPLIQETPLRFQEQGSIGIPRLKKSSHQPAVHSPDSVRCPGWHPGEQAALGKNSARRGYNSPDWPVCTGLSSKSVTPTPTVGRAISGRHVDFTNGRKVTPDCPVCHKGRGCNSRLRQKRKEIVHCGAPDCPVRPQTEGNYDLLNGAPTALAALGL